MIRSYCFLGAAALVFNGPTLAPLVAAYQRAMAVDHSPPVGSPAPPSPPTAFAVNANKGRDGLFCLTGMANRQPVRFIVDTGATVTVLSARDAAMLGLPAGRANAAGTLRTVGGSTAMVWKNIASLDIAGSRLTDVEVVVVDGGVEHSLLGQDVLARLGTITMTPDRLTITPPAA